MSINLEVVESINIFAEYTQIYYLDGDIYMKQLFMIQILKKIIYQIML